MSRLSKYFLTDAQESSSGLALVSAEFKIENDQKSLSSSEDAQDWGLALSFERMETNTKLPKARAEEKIKFSKSRIRRRI